MLTTVDRNRHRLRLLKIIFACTPALLALAPQAIAQPGPGDSQGGQAAAIEGTWIVSIHRVVTGITFSALQSFTAGGVTVATGSGDRIPPPPISPLYGSWTRTDNNTYVATINFFIFDPAGNPVGMIQNNETLRLSGDNKLVGVGTGFFCDINGDHCLNINSPITITGKRLIAQGASN